MIEALLALPSHLRERLAGALESGMLGIPYSDASLAAALGPSVGAEGLRDALKELSGHGMEGPIVARWLRAVAYVEASAPRPDLVWSGPEVPGLHARDTRRVYDELLGSAERSVWISTYAFFDGPRAFEVLAQRMTARPELRVTLLLNIHRRKGDTTARDQLVRQFADRFWRKDWPGSSRPDVFYDPRALDLDGPGAVLHAKAVVTDDESVLVTSANLTEAAFDRNIEIGLLVRDRALAASVSMHFRALIDRELLKPLPSS